MYEKFYSIEYMDLKTISPALYHFRESEIEMPGFAQNMDKEITKPVVKISSFCPKLLVLKSKEKPRKIIIYAIRLYFYLWSGRYIYDYDDLLKTIQDVLFDDVIISSLKKAVDIRRKMDSGEINTNVNSKDYFSLTKGIIKERKMIIDYLGAKDKVYCKKNQEQWIGEVSVLAQGVIV